MKRILIMSGIHGNEVSGPDVVFDFLKKIRRLKKRYEKLHFDVFPVLNPSGYTLGTRKNAEGKDLNRWFFDSPQKDEPFECAILRNFFNSIQEPYDLLISLHEDQDRKKFYLSDTGNSKNSPLIKGIFQTVKKAGVELYTGPDDDDPELG